MILDEIVSATSINEHLTGWFEMRPRRRIVEAVVYPKSAWRLIWASMGFSPGGLIVSKSKESAVMFMISELDQVGLLS